MNEKSLSRAFPKAFQFGGIAIITMVLTGIIISSSDEYQKPVFQIKE